jgi:PKD repeat protein
MVDIEYPPGQEIYALVGQVLDFVIAISDPENDSIELAIDFGDGTPESHVNLTDYVDGLLSYTFSHAYSYEDEFTMIVFYTDNKIGWLDHERQAEITVRVFEDLYAPISDPGDDQTVAIGETVEFDGGGSADDLGIANYTWTFVYDGKSEVLYGQEPVFIFWIPGEYEVTLNVTDFAHFYNTSTVRITVTEVIPEFSTLLIPMIGSILLIAPVIARRRRRP